MMTPEGPKQVPTTESKGNSMGERIFARAMKRAHDTRVQDANVFHEDQAFSRVFQHCTGQEPAPALAAIKRYADDRSVVQFSHVGRAIAGDPEVLLSKLPDFISLAKKVGALATALRDDPGVRTLREHPLSDYDYGVAARELNIPREKGFDPADGEECLDVEDNPEFDRNLGIYLHHRRDDLLELVGRFLPDGEHVLSRVARTWERFLPHLEANPTLVPVVHEILTEYGRVCASFSSRFTFGDAPSSPSSSDLAIALADWIEKSSYWTARVIRGEGSTVFDPRGPLKVPLDFLDRIDSLADSLTSLDNRFPIRTVRMSEDFAYLVPDVLDRMKTLWPDLEAIVASVKLPNGQLLRQGDLMNFLDRSGRRLTDVIEVLTLEPKALGFVKALSKHGLNAELLTDFFMHEAHLAFGDADLADAALKLAFGQEQSTDPKKQSKNPKGAFRVQNAITLMREGSRALELGVSSSVWEILWNNPFGSELVPPYLSHIEQRHPAHADLVLCLSAIKESPRDLLIQVNSLNVEEAGQACASRDVIKYLRGLKASPASPPMPAFLGTGKQIEVAEGLAKRVATFGVNEHEARVRIEKALASGGEIAERRMRSVLGKAPLMLLPFADWVDHHTKTPEVAIILNSSSLFRNLLNALAERDTRVLRRLTRGFQIESDETPVTRAHRLIGASRKHDAPVSKEKFATVEDIPETVEHSKVERVLIFGGAALNDQSGAGVQLTKKLGIPVQVVNAEKAYEGAFKSTDLVVFATGTISHSFYKPTRKAAEGAGAEIFHVDRKMSGIGAALEALWSKE